MIGFVVFLSMISQIYAVMDCGRSQNPFGLIACSSSVRRNDFPWLVSIYDKENGEMLCNGNLVSKQHVVVIGTCVHRLLEKHQKNPFNFFVKIGQFQLKKDKKNFSEVFKYFTLDLFKNSRLEYYAQIFISHLKKQVEFSKVIQPVCLPNYNQCTAHNAYNKVNCNFVVL